MNPLLQAIFAQISHKIRLIRVKNHQKQCRKHLEWVYSERTALRDTEKWLVQELINAASERLNLERNVPGRLVAPLKLIAKIRMVRK